MKFPAPFRNALLSVAFATLSSLAPHASASAEAITFEDLDGINPDASVGGYSASSPDHGFATPAHDDPDLGDIVNVESNGSLDGAAVYDMFIALNKSAPAFLDAMAALRLNAPIDELRFNSTHHSRIATDDLVLTTTPIPAALPLFATALGLGVLALRRRKASKAACRSTQL